MIRLPSSSLVYESDITVALIAFFDTYDLSETLVSSSCRFLSSESSCYEFIHDTLEVKFFLCHTKIGGHRNMSVATEVRTSEQCMTFLFFILVTF